MSSQGITAKWWWPSARRFPGAHRKSRHIPEYTDRFDGRGGRIALRDWTEAPISTGISTGRWWFECPEQLLVTAGPLDHQKFPTTAIAFTMLNREPNGVTYTYKRKPHKYRQSVRSFYYDLGEPSHVDAFLRVCRMLIAYVAEGRRDDFFVEYPLKWVQPIDKYNGSVNLSGFEQVWIEPRPEPLPPGLQMRSGGAPRQPVRPEPVLKIKRYAQVKQKGAWRRVKGGWANLASHFTIPLSVAKKFSDWAGRMLPYMFTDRLTPHVTRPRNLDPEWLPRARHALAWEAESAVFDAPELLVDESGYRFSDPSSVPFTRTYLERLNAYAEGRLRWDPGWVERGAYDDRRYLESLFKRVWPSVVFLQVLCRVDLVFSREKTEELKAYRQDPTWWPCSVYKSRIPNTRTVFRTRAPP